MLTEQVKMKKKRRDDVKIKKNSVQTSSACALLYAFNVFSLFGVDYF